MLQKSTKGVKNIFETFRHFAHRAEKLYSVHTRGVVKKGDLQGVLVKSGDFIKFKGILVEFLQEQALFR